MKKYCFGGLFAILSVGVFAQIPEDALRTSWNIGSGTARSQAIGGAVGALGGEISALFVNPAGMGFFRTSELVVSPGFSFQNQRADYGNGSTAQSASNFTLGTSGFVLGGTTRRGSTALSVAVNQIANFNSHIRYSGVNNYSSFSEQYAEEFAFSGLTIDDALNTGQLSYGTRLALYNYLVDTVTSGGQVNVIAQPDNVLASGGSLNQYNDVVTRGGAKEISLGIAGSYADKLYLGLGIGIPIFNYERTQTITETDGTGNLNNDFASASYHEKFSTRGAGVNLKLGVIYKASDAWKFGFALHTPTFYSMRDRIEASLAANTEGYAGTDSMSSKGLDDNSFNSVRYQLSSPFKMIASASYIFGGQADVRSQKGFITADVEYAAGRGPRFNQPADDDGNYDQDYYSGLNSVVKSYYRNDFNFRLGGEMKFNILAVRAGFAYYASPYQVKDIKAGRMSVSGGVGYRNKGIFIDLTYVETLTKDADFPYRLSTKDNRYAVIRQAMGTVLMTVGFKF